MEFRSNLFYNWGRGFAGYNDDEAALIRYAFIDNAYLAGPDSEGALAFRERNRLARAWFAGNSMNGVDPRRSLVAGRRHHPRRLSARRPARRRARSRPIPRPSAMTRVLAGAGAWPRDAADARVVESVRARSGRHIDSQEEVGGWPELAAGAAACPTATATACRTPGRRAHGFDPARADGNGDRDGDGLTNLEDWLAERAAAVLR